MTIWANTSSRAEPFGVVVAATLLVMIVSAHRVEGIWAGRHHVGEHSLHSQKCGNGIRRIICRETWWRCWWTERIAVRLCVKRCNFGGMWLVLTSIRAIRASCTSASRGRFRGSITNVLLYSWGTFIEVIVGSLPTLPSVKTTRSGFRLLGWLIGLCRQ